MVRDANHLPVSSAVEDEISTRTFVIYIIHTRITRKIHHSRLQPGYISLPVLCSSTRSDWFTSKKVCVCLLTRNVPMLSTMSDWFSRKRSGLCVVLFCGPACHYVTFISFGPSSCQDAPLLLPGAYVVSQCNCLGSPLVLND